MSLPISPAGSILGAARAARDVAGQIAGKIAGAVGFDEVLQEQADSVSVSQKSLIDQAVTAIQDRLSKVGIAANPPIELSVQQDGSLQVLGNHDQAARIESILASDPELAELVSRLTATAGTTRLTIGPDLTRTDAQGTMSGQPGGYANWLAG